MTEKLLDPEDAFPESSDEQFERLLQNAPEELADYARALRMIVGELKPLAPRQVVNPVCPADFVKSAYKVQAFGCSWDNILVCASKAEDLLNNHWQIERAIQMGDILLIVFYKMEVVKHDPRTDGEAS